MSAPTSSLPLQPLAPSAMPRFAPVRLPRAAAQDARENLAVKSCQARAWDLLDEVSHSRVFAFLSGEGGGQTSNAAKGVPYRATGSLPERFLTDFRSGGAGLRRAFPRLARTVERVSTTAHGVAVAIVCHGAHTGAFYDLLCPTGRDVSFSEVHDLVLHDGVLVEDTVDVDLRSVLRQLTGLRSPA